MKTSKKPNWLLMRHAKDTGDELNEIGKEQCIAVIPKIKEQAVSTENIILIYDEQYNRTRETAEFLGKLLEKENYTVEVVGTKRTTGPLDLADWAVDEYFERASLDDNTLVIIIGSLSDIPDALVVLGITKTRLRGSSMEKIMDNTNFLNINEVLEVTASQGGMFLEELEAYMN